MSEEKACPRCVPLACGYMVAEIACDAAVFWVIYSQGHPWWSLAWATITASPHTTPCGTLAMAPPRALA